MSINTKSLERVINGVDRIVPTFAKAVGDELISMTPIDTGHTVGNWLVNVDSTDKSEKGSYPGSVSGLYTAYAGLNSAISSFTKDSRYISFDMNVYYFPYLDMNPGHSSQAPNGVVEPAVDIGIKKALKKLGL